MFKWLSKSGKSANSRIRLRTADGQMQANVVGRLSQDVAEGGRSPEPVPEYIQEAAEPSEDVWAHEQELYRRKQAQDEAGS
jgi:hypothetical protein